MKLELNCPQCQKPTVWQNNPTRPFCSERCQLLDLGQWADESYSIKGAAQEFPEDNNVVSIYSEKQDTERY